MSETVDIFGKSYKAYETTYADKVIAWRLSAPTVEITIGRFQLTYQYDFDRDWGAAWVCWDEPFWAESTPEYQYFNKLTDGMRLSSHDTGFIDELLEAMQNKPFNQGESND
jgi:hypothetical protein